MKILILILIFFILGALFIISNNDLRLIEDKNVSQFSEMYVGWINEIYLNFLSMTGNAVKLNWLPANSS